MEQFPVWSNSRLQLNLRKYCFLSSFILKGKTKGPGPEGLLLLELLPVDLALAAGLDLAQPLAVADLLLVVPDNLKVDDGKV